MTGRAGGPATIAVIGLGRMGARIVKAARRGGIDVVAAYDGAAEPYALQEEPGLAAVLTRDLDRFWATRADLVAIATNGPSHVPLLLEGLARGHRRFMVEKPLATGVTEARQALEEARRHGARVVVNLGRRFSSAWETLAALDGSPELGPLRSAALTVGGGAFGCMGAHYFDIFNRLFGALPERVAARLTEPLSANPRGSQFHDPGGSALLLYPGGRRALVDMGDDVGIGAQFEFLFAHGRVSIADETQPWRIRHRRAADRDRPLTQYGLPLEDALFPGFEPPDIIQATLGALEDGLGDGPTVAGIEHGLASVTVFAAVRWAGATGAMVDLPLPAAACDAAYPIT